MFRFLHVFVVFLLLSLPALAQDSSWQKDQQQAWDKMWKNFNAGAVVGKQLKITNTCDRPMRLHVYSRSTAKMVNWTFDVDEAARLTMNGEPFRFRPKELFVYAETADGRGLSGAWHLRGASDYKGYMMAPLRAQHLRLQKGAAHFKLTCGGKATGKNYWSGKHGRTVIVENYCSKTLKLVVRHREKSAREWISSGRWTIEPNSRTSLPVPRSADVRQVDDSSLYMWVKARGGVLYNSGEKPHRFRFNRKRYAGYSKRRYVQGPYVRVIICQ